jgi:HEAT repeat protein
LRAVDLYYECVRILLGEPSDSTLWTCAQKLAYQVHAQGKSCFSNEELSTVIAQVAMDVSENQKAENYIEGLIEKPGLLCSFPEGQHAFRHLALQEYLVAREIYQSNGVATLIKHVDDPWWHEVIVLLAGLQREATDLVKFILAEGEDTEETLLVAARCLHDADQTNNMLEGAILGRLFELFDREEPDLWPRTAAAIAGIEGKGIENALVEFLQDADCSLRRDAATALGRIGEDWAVLHLVEALWDGDWKVRERAAWALGEHRDRRSLPTLVESLGDDRAEVSRAAARSLSCIGDPAIEPLIWALRDQEEQIREMAATALGELGVQAMGALIAAFASEREEVRRGAARALREMDEVVLEHLVDALDHESAEMRLGAARALGRTNNKQAAQLLVGVLGDPDEAVRAEAMRSLVKGGVAAVHPLIDALTDESREVSKRAAAALIRIGYPAIDGLIAALENESKATRLGAVNILKEVGVDDRDAMDRLGELLKHTQEGVRRSAVMALAGIGGDQRIKFLVEALDSEDSFVHTKAADALLATSSDRVVERLREAFFEESVRPERIIEVASRVGSDAAHEFLRQLLGVADESIRIEAARALETDGSDGLYFYGVWERIIEEHLLDGGRITTRMLRDTPEDLRTTVLQRYLDHHSGTSLRYDPEAGILELSSDAFQRVRRVFDLWDSASQNLDDQVELSDKVFLECVTRVADELCDVIGLERSPVESYERLYGFHLLDLSSVVNRTRLPRTLPLVFLREGELQEADTDRLRFFLAETMKTGHRVALLALFAEGEAYDQAMQLLRQRMESVYAYDIIFLGKREIQSVVTAREAQAALRSVLCDQADLSVVCPYRHQGPVPGDMFFGRKSETKEITRAVRDSSVAVLGPRRIGKTSLLRHVQRFLGETHRCFFLDCQATRSYKGFFAQAEGILSTEGRPSDFAALRSAMADLRGEKPLALIIDEVDSLLEFDMENGGQLFATFRSLSQAELFQFVFSGGRYLHNHLKYCSESPLFNFCDLRVDLGYLKRPSACELVVEPMASIGIDLEPESQLVTDVLDLTSCHPRLIQYVCRGLIREIQREDRSIRHITAEHLDRIVESSEFGTEFFNTVWGRATRFEKALTLVFGRGPRSQQGLAHELHNLGIPFTREDLQNALEYLEFCSIVRRIDGVYVLVPKPFSTLAQERLEVEMYIRALRSGVGSG